MIKTRIKVLRAMYDMTQKDLADKLKVSRQTINAVEAGKYSPSLELAFKIANLFDTKVEDVFQYEEE